MSLPLVRTWLWRWSTLYLIKYTWFNYKCNINTNWFLTLKQLVPFFAKVTFTAAIVNVQTPPAHRTSIFISSEGLDIEPTTLRVSRWGNAPLIVYQFRKLFFFSVCTEILTHMVHANTIPVDRTRMLLMSNRPAMQLDGVMHIWAMVDPSKSSFTNPILQIQCKINQGI